MPTFVLAGGCSAKPLSSRTVFEVRSTGPVVPSALQGRLQCVAPRSQRQDITAASGGVLRREDVSLFSRMVKLLRTAGGPQVLSSPPFLLSNLPMIPLLKHLRNHRCPCPLVLGKTGRVAVPLLLGVWETGRSCEKNHGWRCSRGAERPHGVVVARGGGGSKRGRSAGCGGG